LVDELFTVGYFSTLYRIPIPVISVPAPLEGGDQAGKKSSFLGNRIKRKVK
jgi:hypothetical protein